MAEHRDLLLSLAPIKSKGDLAKYLQKILKSGSDLDLLSPGAKGRFIDSLVFNEKGLAGFRYDDLEAELSASEIYGIMSLFGAQHTVPLMDKARAPNKTDQAVMMFFSGEDSISKDYEGYECVSRANCARRGGGLSV